MNKKRIEELMRENNMTKRALAKRSGISERHIHRLLNTDKQNPTFETAQKIAKVFGIHYSAIM